MNGRLLAPLLVMVLAGSVGASSQQSSPPASLPPTPPRDAIPAAAVGTAVIRGRVVRADTGQPIRGARVQTSSGRVRDRLTGLDGRFEITGLAPGHYTLTISKGGFVTLRSGQPSGLPNSRPVPIEVANGQIVDLAYALAKGGVIAGRVVDERGNEVTGAIVAVRRWRWDQGQRYLNGDSSLDDQTDDRGEFRLFGIPAGTIVLGVATQNPFGPGGLTSYYPATYSPTQSEPLTIQAGQEITGLTVTLARPRTASITGTVRRSDGPQVGIDSVIAQPAESRNFGWTPTARIRSDGSYVFTSLPVGEYVLSVSNASTGDHRFATARVTLDTDLVVNLPMRAGDTLRGRYVFDTGSPPADAQLRPAAISRVFVPLDSLTSYRSVGSITPNADGTFEAEGLLGRFYFRPLAPAGWSVKSVRLGNADITDTPLDFNGRDIEGVEVLLTQKFTRLSGTVTGAGVTNATDALVVVFADDETRLTPASRFLSVARPDANGRFTLNGLPPARYLAIAVENLEQGEETNPEMLRRFRRVATSFTLGEGDSQGLDLKLVDWR